MWEVVLVDVTVGQPLDELGVREQTLVVLTDQTYYKGVENYINHKKVRNCLYHEEVEN